MPANGSSSRVDPVISAASAFHWWRSHQTVTIWVAKTALIAVMLCSSGRSSQIATMPEERKSMTYPIGGAPTAAKNGHQIRTLTGQFPTHPNREFIAALQGIKLGDQGNFRDDQGSPLSSAILAFADKSDRPDRSRK
jgi:hypothetical protein